MVQRNPVKIESSKQQLISCRIYVIVNLLSTGMIRFSARGAFLLLVPQGRALIRNRALIRDRAHNQVVKA